MEERPVLLYFQLSYANHKKNRSLMLIFLKKKFVIIIECKQMRYLWRIVFSLQCHSYSCNWQKEINHLWARNVLSTLRHVMQITGIYHAMILNYVNICPPIIFSSRVSLFVFITLNDRKNKLIFFSPGIVIWKFK